MAFAVDEFYGKVADLAQEEVTRTVEGVYERTAAFQLVHVVGHDLGAATGPQMAEPCEAI